MEFAAILKLLGYGGGGGIVVIGAVLSFHAFRLKSLRKTTDKHDKIFHGDGDKTGGLITDTQLTKLKVEQIDEKMDDTRSDVIWIRNYLQNNKK